MKKVLIIALILAGCGGGGAGNVPTPASVAPTASHGGSSYTLRAASIPISISDKLVTVTVSAANRTASMQTVAQLTATQITPTLSTQATAKLVSGQAILVNPVFSTTVTVPDPTDPTKKIQQTVSVTCDTSSIPTVIHVNKANALNYSTGDILVNMDYPTSVSAAYDPQANIFSACSFTYTTGDFIVYGDGSVSSMLDSNFGEVPPPGCQTGIPMQRVIAAGDPNRNPSNVPLFNSLYDTSYVDGRTNTFHPGPLCGSVRALSYSKLSGISIATLNFSNDVLQNNTSFAADSANNFYAIGADRTHGGYTTSTTCPILVTQIGSPGSTCITIPNVANYINYPATGLFQAPYPALFVGMTGAPILSLQTYSYGCGIGYCEGQLSSPTLFNIDPSLPMSSIIPTPAMDASGFPWGIRAEQIPVGFSNGYLMFSTGSNGDGILVNITTGNVIHTCTNIVTGSDYGCSTAESFGDYVYGYVGCATTSNDANLCINIPVFSRTNTLTGNTDTWDLTALGYLPEDGIGYVQVKPIFDTNQVTFLACSAPNFACASPNWVSLDFTTGLITPVTTGGVTSDQLSTIIEMTLPN
jgi:hypothetical protein